MKDQLRRTIIIFIVVLFVVTSLGVGVWGFWAATHPQQPESSQKPDSQACSINSVVGQTATKPEAFKPPVDVTSLAISEIEPGTGQQLKTGDCVIAKYHGTLAADGKEFDGNFEKPLALQFQLGTGQVIPGWDQGLIGMRLGGTRRLVIPSELAYGPQAQGSIPANADLVFVVKVIEVK